MAAAEGARTGGGEFFATEVAGPHVVVDLAAEAVFEAFAEGEAIVVEFAGGTGKLVEGEAFAEAALHPKLVHAAVVALPTEDVFVVHAEFVVDVRRVVGLDAWPGRDAIKRYGTQAVGTADGRGLVEEVGEEHIGTGSTALVGW